MKKAITLIGLVLIIVLAYLAYLYPPKFNKEMVWGDGSVRFTVMEWESNKPIPNTKIEEVNLPGAKRLTCTTDAEGICTLKNLPLDMPLRFITKTDGHYMADVGIRLDSPTPHRFHVMLQPRLNKGEMKWQDFAVNPHEDRDITETIFRENGDGVLRRVQNDVECQFVATPFLPSLIPEEIDRLNEEIRDCRQIQLDVPGCYQLWAMSRDGFRVSSTIRVRDPEATKPNFCDFPPFVN